MPVKIGECFSELFQKITLPGSVIFCTRRKQLTSVLLSYLT